MPFYRVPAPGSRSEAQSYEEPMTLPASDIAGNPYYKRDHRRNYPQISCFNQSTIAGLLSYGSAASPRIADGEKGKAALATVSTGQLSLTQVLGSATKDVVSGSALEKTGLPPLPPSLKSKCYRVVPVKESGMYDDQIYPVRTFT